VLRFWQGLQVLLFLRFLGRVELNKASLIPTPI
jgi:hypothetical protein